MLLQLLALGGATIVLAVAGAPSLASASVASLDSGTLGVSDASVRVAWDVVNPDSVSYETRIYRDGVLIAALDNTVELLDIAVSGYVESHSADITITWNFRVDVVRKSDGLQVATQTAAPLVLTYRSTFGGG